MTKTLLMRWSIRMFAFVAVGCLTACGLPAPGGSFPKQVDVFGIQVKATANTPDEKVLHAATVLAEYLDNDEDGSPDNPAVVSEMVKRRASLVMARTEAELPFLAHFPGASQVLFGEETLPNGSGADGFDATLEEVLHLITHVGYAHWKSDVFGEHKGSLVADAMDVARGGHFTRIPDRYPPEAWYTYDDRTCDYSCMVAEYIYWALTSILGAQDYPGRLEQIQHEWRLNTKSKVAEHDPLIFGILTDERYNLPSVQPDGNYAGIPIIISGGN